MKLIPLQGKLGAGEFAKVDDSDYEYLSNWNWSFYGGYAARTTTVKDVGHKRIFMHHHILPQKDGYLTDHKNLDRLDNQRTNLRYSTPQQNLINKRGRTACGYKGIGVRKVKNGIRYVSCIMKDGVHYWLGAFDTPEIAAKEYDKKAFELYGEYAFLNFPEEL